MKMERHLETKSEEKKRRESQGVTAAQEEDVEEIWRKAARHELGQEEDDENTS